MITRVEAGKLGGVAYRISLRNGGEKVQFNKAAKTPLAIQKTAKKLVAGIAGGKIKINLPAE